ncbi:MAG: hypothetical protein R2744_08095 [Bacteroidales bacterium]
MEFVVPDILSRASIEYMTGYGNGVTPVGWKATTAKDPVEEQALCRHICDGKKDA